MAKRQSNLLNDLLLKQYVRVGAPVAKSDGAGLTFTLSSAGTAAWILRFSHGGRQQEITLGRYPDLGLSAARKLAAEKRVEVQQGRNPALAVRRAKTRKDWTVRQLAEDYKNLVLSKLSDSTQRGYGRNLKRIESGMGAMSVTDVEPSDIVVRVEKAQLGWVESNTLLTVMKALFRHAAGKKIINVNPAIGVELSAILGERPEKRKRLMLTAEELHVLMTAKMSTENRLAVGVLLATGVRISELFTARREHVFLDEARWHIPKSKTGPEMDIPLAPAVVEWLGELAKVTSDSAYVIPARLRTRNERFDGDAHISKDAIREAIDFWITNHEPKIRRFTPHDLRSTMKSHMRKLGVSSDISEMCLNHKLVGVEGIYDQHNYYDERRAALELWACFLLNCEAGHEWTVRPFRQSAA
ncbi:phage integrase [Caballeronia sordidicola]|uniref:Phage integrase n=1 Tax=Caballeronia sordidicola TaxID=196367 RepID=A0A158EX79_CABSO|nr:site-specific integrase [Caballeronia sordidicola]SAL12103.1 phage integrase [Caballeronia sordidicola]